MKENVCPRHKSTELQYLYDGELDNQFGVAVMYCPALECDYVVPRAIGSEPGPLDAKKNELLLMTAARQKVFFKKFFEHFVGDGK